MALRWPKVAASLLRGWLAERWVQGWGLGCAGWGSCPGLFYPKAFAPRAKPSWS